MLLLSIVIVTLGLLCVFFRTKKISKNWDFQSPETEYVVLTLMKLNKIM